MFLWAEREKKKKRLLATVMCVCVGRGGGDKCGHWRLVLAGTKEGKPPVGPTVELHHRIFCWGESETWVRIDPPSSTQYLPAVACWLCGYVGISLFSFI